jgi:hypothetical protein
MFFLLGWGHTFICLVHNFPAIPEKNKYSNGWHLATIFLDMLQEFFIAGDCIMGVFVSLILVRHLYYLLTC